MIADDEIIFSSAINADTKTRLVTFLKTSEKYKDLTVIDEIVMGSPKLAHGTTMANDQYNSNSFAKLIKNEPDISSQSMVNSVPANIFEDKSVKS